MTRYYYTDITKVLYMILNFGIEFECIDDEEDGAIMDFSHYGCEYELIENFIEDAPHAYPEKIYVKKKFNNFFKKTTSDICQKVGDSCQIILRGDKHFFEPEVEND